MTNPQPPPEMETDVEHEFQEIGEEFGCQRLKGEQTDAFALRLLEYVSEMTSEMRAVEDRIRHLISAVDHSK